MKEYKNKESKEIVNIKHIYTVKATRLRDDDYRIFQTERGKNLTEEELSKHYKLMK